MNPIRSSLFILSIVLLLTAAGAHAQTFLYVDSSNVSTQDGSSWGTAFRSLGEALNQANSGNGAFEIYVAKGTYFPTNDLARDSAFRVLRDGIRIYGGFPSGGGVRDIHANPTQLSGNIGSLSDTNDNSYHVLTIIANGNADSIGQNTVIDGFVIKLGNANSTGSFVFRGKSIINNCGGGLVIWGSGNGNHCNPLFQNCTLFKNTASNKGGGMYNNGTAGNSSPSLIHCTFTGNNAYVGGALYNDAFNGISSPYIEGCAFLSNAVKGSLPCGGAIYNYGTNGICCPRITNSVFEKNYAGYNCPGIYNNGITGVVHAVISNCTFSNNLPAGGNASYSNGNTGDCQVLFNNTIFWGGAIKIVDANSATTLLNYCCNPNYYNGTGSIIYDPLFINPNNLLGNDGLLGTADDGLMLQANSPAVDMGQNNLVPAGLTEDIAGNRRIKWFGVDMGAYESPGCSCPAVSTVYVDSSRVSSGRGDSWATAIKTLSEAIHAANQCSIVKKIMVARGTYFPTIESGFPTHHRDSSFRILRDSLEIYGGYPTGGGLRDLSNNPVSLSGNILDENDSTDNCYHIMTLVPIGGGRTISSSTILDGLNFIGGNADGSGTLITGGGVLERNMGGAIYMYGASSANACSPILRYCTFSGNHSTNNGGAIASNGSSNGNCSPQISYCTFTNNTAGYSGGALCNTGSTGGVGAPLIDRCSFINNQALNGGAIGNEGSSGKSRVTVYNSCFIDNTAPNAGGGIYNDGSASGDDTTKVVNCLFYNNKSLNGGVFYDKGNSGNCYTSIINCTFYRNEAVNEGGILYGDGTSGNCSGDLRNSIVWETASPFYNINSSVVLAACTTGDTNYYPGGGNNHLDPQFSNTASPAGFDGIFGTLDDGLRLRYGSPMINTGHIPYLPSVITTDITGDPRIQRGLIDRGPFEGADCQTLYVDSCINVSGDGLSWATAFKTLTEALAQVNLCSGYDSVLIARGTYFPTRGNGSPTTCRDSSFRIVRNRVRLYGGYPSGGGQRNPELFPTLLSGDIGVPNDTADNSYHILNIIACPQNDTLGPSLIIDGITFSDGCADGSSFIVCNGENIYRANGGAVYLVHQWSSRSNPVFSNCRFLRNNANYDGAGLFINIQSKRCNASFIDCIFSDNRAAFQGGAIFHDASNSGRANMSIVRCKFENNRSIGGGALFDSGHSGGISKTTIKDSEFLSNAAGAGGAIQNDAESYGVSFVTISNCIFNDNYSYGSGGVIRAASASYTSSNCNPIISNSVFNRNKANNAGGVISTNSSGSCADDSRFVITSCSFNDNEANDGGVISTNPVFDCGPEITHCTFSNNIAHNSGGVMATSGGIAQYYTTIFNNCSFYGNTAAKGGVFSLGLMNNESILSLTNDNFIANRASNRGGIINAETYQGTSQMYITNCSMYDNTAANPGDIIYSELTSTMGESDHTVTNCIVWGVDHPFELTGPMNQFITYNIIQGDTVWPGTANSNADPMLRDPSNPWGFDGLPGTEDDGMRLAPGSPAINAGNNAQITLEYDITGAARIQNGTVDLGAFEGGDCLNLYVDSSRLVSGPGTSWDSAFRTLTEALYLANQCSGNDSIFVARGTYFPSDTTGAPAASRDSSFCIKRDKIKLIGGFPSGGGTRDFIGQPVVLSGNIGNDTSQSDNSFHVMTVISNGGNDTIGHSTIVDGFRFSDGVADSSGNHTIHGKLIKRSAGGGLYLFGGTTGNQCNPVFRNCIFNRNTAASNGGAVYSDASSGKSDPTFYNCAFSENSAVRGGAIFLESLQGRQSPLIAQSLFFDNAADTGAVFYLSHLNQNPAPVIVSCSFFNDSAAAGSTLYNFAGSVIPALSNSIVWDHDTSLFNGSVNPEVHNSLVRGGFSGSGNINSNPLFADTTDIDGADNLLFTSDDGLALLDGSPAINRAENQDLPGFLDRDIRGAARIQWGTADIGAYESGYFVWPNQHIVYVNGLSPVSGTGESWSSPFRYLNEALTIANQCTVVDSILVTGGYYSITTGNGEPTTCRDSSFRICRNGITLLGGYQGNRGYRNPALYPSILSGNLGAANDSSDNSFHIMTIIPCGPDDTIDGSTLIDGFCFTGGLANDSGTFLLKGHPVKNSFGGAVYLYGENMNKSCNPVFAHCSFYDNAGNGGGAVYANGSDQGRCSPDFVSCNFIQNTALSKGGAVFTDGFSNGTADARIINCGFTGNKATEGSAVYSYYGNNPPAISNSILWGDNQQVSGITTLPTVEYSTIQNGYPGSGNISADPLFMDYAHPLGPDRLAGTADDGIRLQGGSPAINAGNNASLPSGFTLDLLFNERIQQGVVDMGPYENYCSFSATQYFTIMDGDSISVGVHNYFTSGIYYDTLVTANFCDSILITQLTVLSSVQDQQQERPVLQIFPNPNHGEFILETQKDARIGIYNIFGVKVYEFLAPQGMHTISLVGLAPGIYFVDAVMPDEHYCIKMIVD